MPTPEVNFTKEDLPKAPPIEVEALMQDENSEVTPLDGLIDTRGAFESGVLTVISNTGETKQYSSDGFEYSTAN